MKSEKIKISFTGDILCDYPELIYMKKNKYKFEDIFCNIKLKEKKEFLVGNLETPICDSLPYTFEPYSFNSPSKFCEELSRIGFNLVSIANNHCLDRGIYGLKQTIKNLKKVNIIPNGVYNRDDKPFDIIEIDNKKIAFISYTYGTNYTHNKYYVKNNEDIKINLLKQQNNYNEKIYSKKSYIYSISKNYLKNTILWKKCANLKHKLKKENIKISKSYSIDNIDKNQWIIQEEYIKEIEKNINNAKKNADFVIMLIHSGGQFNGDIGTYTKEIINIITKLPVDLIIGNHPHIVQKFEYVNNKPVFYSLGNFCFSPSSKYINFENKPEYSIKVNCYINNSEIKLKYEILKNLNNIHKNHTEIRNTYDLINELKGKYKKELIEDCNFIINRIKDTYNIIYIDKLQKEYEI